MCLPGTGNLFWRVENPGIRQCVTESQADPLLGIVPTPGSAYGQATPDLRPNPASSILIAAEHPGLVLLNPDPDQIARDIVPLRQAVQGLAAEKFLRDLPFEFDAMGSMFRHGFHPSEARQPGQFIPAPCPPPGAHSNPGSRFGSDSISVHGLKLFCAEEASA